MKDKRWFPHELGARTSPALVRLQIKLGGIGLAIYWCLMEMLYENGGRLPKDYQVYAYEIKWAKEEDIQAVAESKDLFDSDDTCFWDDSVLDYISHMKDISEKRSTAARAKAKSRSLTADEGHGSNSQAIDQQLQSNCKANAKQDIDNRESITKKEDVDNDSIEAIITESEKDEVLEIFFLVKNFTHPVTEMKRFIRHYSTIGWCYSDGTAIKNKLDVAKQWKPNDVEPRFDWSLLAWYQSVYDQAKGKVPDAVEIFLVGLVRMEVDRDNNLIMSYDTQEHAISARNFVAANGLELSGKRLDWRFSN